ncbi:hypothetical protein NXC24_PC01469 (plasmid) [Rhizobium sp. NXC24]|nr:hypothetical protein NXC24_PC01469 [Rhizobium sp. NXC24]
MLGCGVAAISAAAKDSAACKINRKLLKSTNRRPESPFLQSRSAVVHSPTDNQQTGGNQ